MSSPHPTNRKRHLLTVLLEDYFHVGAFNSLIQRGQWYRFQTRFEQNTLKSLELLDRFDIKATFFVLGWIADKQPELVREVARRGHEIASRGYHHRSISQMTPAEFREDLARSRDALELASGRRVIGYRAARRLTAPADLWALDVLADEGYAYDSSLLPTHQSESWRRFAHQHTRNDKTLWEFPISTISLLGWRMPIAGGNYFRQFPHTLVKRAVEHWDKTYDAPFVMYTHVWELDPHQPRISGASPIAKIRHYRNLDKMVWILEDYFRKYSFVGAADYLGIDTSRADLQPSSSEVKERPSISLAAQAETLDAPLKPISSESKIPQAVALTRRTPVSIVVPCFNEELVLPYLANTLRSVETALESDYELRFIFVDDCSTDGTWSSLQQSFDSRPNCAFVRHPENRGVAAAILTGIGQAETEIVCSIDCDCTYDPHELGNMIPRLSDDIDMVTASPYHPQGEVRNVPNWRLTLSKGASFLYRQVLTESLYTYTSCFRVYRRSAMVKLQLKESGFLGIAEMLGRLDLSGSKIVEYPTTLEVRLFGRSKMKVIKTIGGHLQLLAYLLALRLRRARQAKAAPAEEALQSEAKNLPSGYHTTTITSQK
jgi:polysaccharide deacetylase family protein (PEP-CTERM system associated)